MWDAVAYALDNPAPWGVARIGPSHFEDEELEKEFCTSQVAPSPSRSCTGA